MTTYIYLTYYLTYITTILHTILHDLRDFGLQARLYSWRLALHAELQLV